MMTKHLNHKGIIVLIALLFSVKTYGNINAIDFTKVNTPANLKANVKFLQDHLGLYDHWVHEWKAGTRKDDVITSLSALYDGLDKQQDKNVETYLLLGDIAHYLYNIELEPCYKKALDNYTSATQLAPTDYRTFWFLGNHYALSAQPEKSIETYQLALNIKPQNISGHFWFDYAFATLTAGMPSTAKFAVSQSIKLFGHANDVSKATLQSLNASLKQPPKDTSLLAKDIWSLAGKQGGKYIIANRLIGTRMATDSTWGVSTNSYENQVTAISFKPTTIISKISNKPIDYSILVMAKIPKSGQSLSDFMSVFVKPEYKTKPVHLTDKYKDCITYEITDPDVYQNIGGGHMYMMAIARDEPENPGMLLESATGNLNHGEAGKINYYNIGQTYSRLKGKLYYIVLLDSCGYIHDESLSVFKDFIENGLVIE
ncbi:tetratricopeptide repeat protein [Mucilaginibacter dorajii]|nr:hypothetical protein [Mucilaginibacter dorajii]MCS3735836.1 tetratricopeptide (TPR) repeat protein [Mucilaginibacter dorajii]